MNAEPTSLALLLVEDNPADADLIHEYLDESPSERYAIVSVTLLEQAVTWLRDTATADLVLLDLRLPDASGIHTLKAVKEVAGDVPIVVLTGVRDEGLALSCIDAGAQDYLVKEDLRPISLHRSLSYAVSRRREAQARDRMAEQLRQAQKMEAIGTLASGIAHEVNNILAVIGGAASLARADAPADHPVQINLDEIERAVDRGRDVVRQVLTFGRRDEIAERENLDPAKVVADAIRFLRATLPASIELAAAADADLPRIRANATQLHQILMNLGANAAHAMREGGGTLEIRVGAVEVDAAEAHLLTELTPGRYVRLAVRDTGEGMDAETVGRIFEPFFTTKSEREGTGLGLSVVHGIVKSHGGAITAYSEPGKGTEFHLYFPIAESTVAAVEPVAHAGAPGRGERILFVDDEPAIVGLYTRLLERQGYEVTGFHESEAALAAFLDDPDRFDLVVTDLSMPKLDGPALVRRLLEVRPELPIVMATGYIGDRDAERGEANGVRELVHKPYSMEILTAALRRALGADPDDGPAS